jgi:hypothetical protein
MTRGSRALYPKFVYATHNVFSLVKKLLFDSEARSMVQDTNKGSRIQLSFSFSPVPSALSHWHTCLVLDV